LINLQQCQRAAVFIACITAPIAITTRFAQAAEAHSLNPTGTGFSIGDDSSIASATINTRAQIRYTSQYVDDPRETDDFLAESDSKLNINRARLKIEGHIYQPWIRYFSQFELADGYFIDYGLAIEKYAQLNVKIGQWKMEYSRERSVSSGEQQLIDRSIINRMFTIDRHNAISVYGRLNPDTLADVNYWVGIGAGTGRGNSLSSPGKPLYFARVQWNPLGGGVDFTTADLATHTTPALSIGYAHAWNEGQYSRFSSSGGGQLGLWKEVQEAIDATPLPHSLTKINQYNVDMALMYKGFSAQAEYHEKEVSAQNQNDLSLDGYYIQAGYLLNSVWQWWPKPLEVVGRYATYTSQQAEEDRKNEEHSVGLNWYFAGHNNKLSVDFTRFDLHALNTEQFSDNRFRVQWDFTF